MRPSRRLPGRLRRGGLLRGVRPPHRRCSTTRTSRQLNSRGRFDGQGRGFVAQRLMATVRTENESMNIALFSEQQG